MDTASVARPLQTKVQKTRAWITWQQTLIQTLSIFITIVALLVTGEIWQGPAAVVQSVLRAVYVFLAKLWTLSIGATIVRAIWWRNGFFPYTPFEKKIISLFYIEPHLKKDGESCAHWTSNQAALVRVLARVNALCLGKMLYSHSLFPSRWINYSTRSPPALG